MTSTSLRPLRWPNRTTPSVVANRVSSLPRRTLSPGWNFVPRWRTMIAPARTFVPVVTFTPSRWDAESRPFLDEDAPFFFDMSTYAFFGGRLVAGVFFVAGAFFFAGAFFVAGAFLGAPPAVMPVISITEYRCRCPHRFRLFVLGLYVKPVTFGPRVSLTTRALTRAASSSFGVASTRSPSTTRTGDSSTSRASPSRSTSSCSPSSTRYCLPPLWITAYINQVRLSNGSLQEGLVDEEAAALARRARLAERLDQALRDPLPGHLHEPQLGDVE